jgi:hypothetical protein
MRNVSNSSHPGWKSKKAPPMLPVLGCDSATMGMFPNISTPLQSWYARNHVPLMRHLLNRTHKLYHLNLLGFNLWTTFGKHSIASIQLCKHKFKGYVMYWGNGKKSHELCGWQNWMLSHSLPVMLSSGPSGLVNQFSRCPSCMFIKRC